MLQFTRRQATGHCVTSCRRTGADQDPRAAVEKTDNERGLEKDLCGGYRLDLLVVIGLDGGRLGLPENGVTLAGELLV